MIYLKQTGVFIAIVAALCAFIALFVGICSLLAVGVTTFIAFVLSLFTAGATTQIVGNALAFLACIIFLFWCFLLPLWRLAGELVKDRQQIKDWKKKHGN